MAKNIASHVSTRKTAQSERIPGPQGTRQVENSAGGYSFQVSKWDRLNRFLILGSDKGSYYASEAQLTRENAQCVYDCAAEDFDRTLQTIVDVSDQGRAPKNDPAILALALLCAHEAPNSTKAFAELPKVCRIGTHLFTMLDMLQHLRGRGRAFRRAFQQWYLAKSAKDVAFQVTKYQQRNGWSHADVLRLVKPKGSEAEDKAMDGVFAYVTGKSWQDKLPEGPARTYIEAVEAVKAATVKTQVVNLIREYNLPREVIPTNWLNEPTVWEAMLERMPATALVRNLGKMSSIGLAKPMSTASGTICAKLSDGEWLRKSRVHPIAMLIALQIYKSGHGLRGGLTWSPDSNIVDALDEAFYTTFGHVTPSGKRHLLAIDISASMTWNPIANTMLTPRDGAAAMAMLAVRTEPQTHVTAFSSGGWSAGNRTHSGIRVCGDLTKRSRLDHAVSAINRMGAGGTDCSLPMQYALANKIEADVFVVYTDNETWAGSIHPVQALRQYREKMGIPAKLIVVGMVSNGFTIADPNDAGMLDVVGFDTAAPNVMSDFARG